MCLALCCSFVTAVFAYSRDKRLFNGKRCGAAQMHTFPVLQISKDASDDSETAAIKALFPEVANQIGLLFSWHRCCRPVSNRCLLSAREART